MFGDTPQPVEEPGGENPAEGTAIDYFLPGLAKDISLEVFDTNGNQVIWFTNHDKPEQIDSMNYQHPLFWIKPVQILSTSAGHHRFTWDLRYAKPEGAERQLPIWANYKRTPLGPLGPFVAPGQYKIKLTADGVSNETTLSVRIDPRVAASVADIELQSKYSLLCYQNYQKLQSTRDVIEKKTNDVKTKKELKDKLHTLRGKGTVENADILYGAAYDSPTETIISLQNKLIHILTVLQSADEKPTQSTIQAAEKLSNKTNDLLKQFDLITRK